MLSQRLSVNKSLYLFGALLVVVLQTSITHADEQSNLQTLNTYPKRVCVFDLDKTLVENGSNDVTKPYAKASVAKCISEGYGIAFATARESKLRPRKNAVYLFKAELASSPWSSYTNVVENNERGSYTNVDDTGDNPLYLSNTLPKNSPLTKWDAMDRLLRTFYGYGVGKANETDPNNPYVKQHSNPNKKGLSGCLVLFDDTQQNIDDISTFNTKNNMNFQAVKVDGSIGVTTDNIQTGINNMNRNCNIQ